MIKWFTFLDKSSMIELLKGGDDIHRVSKKEAQRIYLKGIRVSVRVNTKPNEEKDSWKLDEVRKEENEWNEELSWDALVAAFKEYQCGENEFPIFCVD